MSNNLTVFYKNIDGNYTDMIQRINNESLILKFIKKFPSDTSFQNLEEALNCDDFKAAFISVHTLKGVALNLSFTKLASVCSELTEYLRNYENLNISRDIAIEKFEIIKENYQKVVDEIIKLEQF